MPSSTHDSESLIGEQRLLQTPDDEWQQILVPLLPKAFEQQARKLGAFHRARGLHSACDLLRGLLAYALWLNSFRQVGSWAASIGLSRNGERSWAKRLRQAQQWVCWLLQELLSPALTPAEVQTPAGFAGRILLVDATHVRTWKRTGETCLLHSSYDLLAGSLHQVRITDQHAGERLTHFSMQPGDILVADRGYCRRQALAETLAQGWQVVVRLHWNNLPLQREDGTLLDVCQWVQQLPTEQGELLVWMSIRKQRFPLRLLACRLHPEAAGRAQRSYKAKASKNKARAAHPWAQVLTEWLLLVTSLPQQQWSLTQVLSLYRARWQIELLFKRIKQLVRVHRLRSHHPQTTQAVLAVLLIGWVLLEQQARAVRTHLHTWQAEQEAQQEGKHAPVLLGSWEVCASLLQSLRTMILGSWTWQQILSHLPQLRRVLTTRPQKRAHQESQIVEQLAHWLSPLEL